MIYGSVCSGIESATAAWHPLGWKPAFFAEREKAPSAVLKQHYPDVPNHGDITKFEEWPDYAIDVLVGGTPCQSFSVAGLRAGMVDPRGNLALTFLAIADRYRPQWIIFENVPGLLSSNGGRDFGSFLGGLGKLGWGFAYRILDAQYVRTQSHPWAVPQRRRRVFVVGYLGDWRRAAAVLFERQSLSGDPPPRREAGQRTSGTIEASLGRSRGAGQSTSALTEAEGSAEGLHLHELQGGERGDMVADMRVVWSGADRTAEIAPSLGVTRHGYPTDSRGQDPVVVDVAPTMRAGGNKTGGDRPPGTDVDTADSLIAYGANDTSGAIDAAAALNANRGCHNPGDFEAGTLLVQPVAHTLRAEHDATDDGSGKGTPMIPVVAFDSKRNASDSAVEEVSPTLRAMGADQSHANAGGQLAVAFQPRFARNGRGAPDVVAAPLTAQAGETGKGDSANCVAFVQSAGEDNGNAEETDTNQALSALRKIIGEEATAEWRSGVLVSLQAQEVLQPDLHGGSIRREANEAGRRMDDGALSREESKAPVSLREMWSEGRARRTPQRRELPEQLARQLDEALSRLPLAGAPPSWLMQDLRGADEGTGVLQQALPPIQAGMAVRRLTPMECCRLQGFPDDYLDSVKSDGPKYKMLGNSMAVNVMSWLGERIEMVSKL